MPSRDVSINFGLVTYMWGADWDLATLLDNCARAGLGGVELRTTHKHGVEPSLSADQRADVKRRFTDSPVRLVGLGSDERFDNPDAGVLQKAIEATRGFIKLSHDVGGSGVKVKPDRFHDGVPRERTIEQIGRALKTLGAFAEGYGQQVRLEVHGQCAELPTIEAIMAVADHPSVAVCWNSNDTDLKGDGLERNFERVKKRLGATLHVRPLDGADYPYPKLIELLVKADWNGWMLLEAGGKPPDDRVGAMKAQRALFDRLVEQATRK
jgi:sugar phosphate isomerase/epimerase